jgi:hypothetical protein
MQQYQDLLIDALLDQGFTLVEAEQLVALQARLEYEHVRISHQQEYERWMSANQKTEPKDVNY